MMEEIREDSEGPSELQKEREEALKEKRDMESLLANPGWIRLSDHFTQLLNQMAVALISAPITKMEGLYSQEYDKGQAKAITAILQWPSQQISNAQDMKEAIDERPSADNDDE